MRRMTTRTLAASAMAEARRRAHEEGLSCLEWIRRDERGTFEALAHQWAESTAEKAAALGLSDAEHASELATAILLAATTAAIRR